MPPVPRPPLPPWAAPGDDGLAHRRAVARPRRRRRRAVAAAGAGRCSPGPLLLVALSRVSPVVRAQTAVVVVFATVVEYVFSPTLEVYTYRFDNVPAFVPPGHGLVYLSAFATRSRGAGAAAPAHGGRAGAAGRRRLGGVRRRCSADAPRRPRRVLVPVPGAVHALRTLAAGVPRGVRRGQLAGAGRHAPRHLGVGHCATPRAGCRSATRLRGRPVATGGSTSPGCSPRRTCCAVAAQAHCGRRTAPEAVDAR